MLLLSFQDILEKLKSEIFKLGDFSVSLWMIIAAGLLVLIILLIIIISCAKKRNKTKEIKEIEETEETLETVTIISSEETKLDETKTEEVIEEEKIEETTEEEVKMEKTKKTPTKKESAKKKTTKKETKVEEVKVEETSEEKLEKKERPRVYHVSLREDGKWQVKFAKGAKAIKTFATQLEAIEYAKKLAASQEGSIMIHKKDGKIRKQKY
jgi:outer membrane biosynthesis protein TonB